MACFWCPLLGSTPIDKCRATQRARCWCGDLTGETANMPDPCVDSAIAQALRAQVHFPVTDGLLPSWRNRGKCGSIRYTHRLFIPAGRFLQSSDSRPRAGTRSCGSAGRPACGPSLGGEKFIHYRINLAENFGDIRDDLENWILKEQETRLSFALAFCRN